MKNIFGFIRLLSITPDQHIIYLYFSQVANCAKIIKSMHKNRICSNCIYSYVWLLHPLQPGQARFLCGNSDYFRDSVGKTEKIFVAKEWKWLGCSKWSKWGVTKQNKTVMRGRGENFNNKNRVVGLRVMRTPPLRDTYRNSTWLKFTLYFWINQIKILQDFRSCNCKIYRQYDINSLWAGGCLKFCVKIMLSMYSRTR